jgi:hypothetical protein
MVMDVWQATLMRAFAQQLEYEQFDEQEQVEEGQQASEQGAEAGEGDA